MFHDPWVGTDLEHVEIVIGFEDKAVTLTQVHLHVIWQISKVRTNCDLCTIGAKSESHRVSRIMRNSERVHIDVANGKTLASLDGFDTAKALAEGVRKDAPERVHGGFGNVKRGLPEAEDLGKAVAVVGVLVGDEDGVEAINVAFDGGEAGESLAFTEAGVDKDAGGFAFEQGDVARAAGGKDGNAKADDRSTKGRRPRRFACATENRKTK